MRHNEEMFFTPGVDPQGKRSPIIVTHLLRNWRVVLTPQAEHGWVEERIPLGNITPTLAGEELLPLCISNPTGQDLGQEISGNEDLLDVADWLRYWDKLKASPSLASKERLWSCFRHLKVNPIYGHHVVMMLLVVHLIIGHRRLQRRGLLSR